MTLLLWIVTVVIVAFVFAICKEMANKPGTEAAMRWTLGIGAVVVAGMWWGYTSWKNDPAREIERAQKDCNDSTMAYVMSQNFVKQRLKSPASADFPYMNGRGVVSVPDEECNFFVSAYVDSQNGFGAKIRAYYETKMSYDRETKLWRASDLVIK